MLDSEKSGRLTLSDFLVLTPFEVRQTKEIQKIIDLVENDENKENNNEAENNGDKKKNEDADEETKKETDDVDEKTLELALNVFNERADKIDKEELYKAPYVLCEASGQDARGIFDTDEQFAKKKFLVFENDKLDRDEFLRLVRGCKRFIV